MKTKKGVNSKTFVVLLVMVLVVGCVIGGSVAWLVSNPAPVVNTFTYGDITITLAETTGNSYKILPGNDITKNPKVTVQANSEDCWLFVKVEESNWPTFKETDGTTLKVKYQLADGWAPLENVSGVYFKTVDAATSNTEFAVLADNKITVSQNLTKAEVDTVRTTNPTLTFTAYAVQRDSNITTAAQAWTIANS
ncbi:MAG: hypothetical protein ACI4WY_02095 [Anaerovoracaceae bacterium]